MFLGFHRVSRPPNVFVPRQLRNTIAPQRKRRFTDQNGSTTYSASDLFSGLLYNNRGFTSAIWPQDAGDFVDFGFGLDSHSRSSTAGTTLPGMAPHTASPSSMP
jgi:hypothetical protein